MALPCAANFGGCSHRRGLRGLAPGVRVDLRVEDQDVHVAFHGENVVESAVADVVGPAVSTDEPDALADEVVGDGIQAPRLHARQTGLSFLRSAPTRSRCSRIPSSVVWSAVGGAPTSSSPELGTERFR